MEGSGQRIDIGGGRKRKSGPQPGFWWRIAGQPPGELPFIHGRWLIITSGGTEVSEFHRPVITGQQQIFRHDIAVDDAQGMAVGQGGRSLPQQVHGLEQR